MLKRRGGRPEAIFRVLLPIFAVAVMGCTGPPGGATTYPIGGHALAGPTCPVEPASPIPGQCDPRPVSGAVLIVIDAGGQEIARLNTGSDGTFATSLSAGSYTLTPQPVTGLLGIAPPVQFTVSAGEDLTSLRVEYDTGIR